MSWLARLKKTDPAGIPDGSASLAGVLENLQNPAMPAAANDAVPALGLVSKRQVSSPVSAQAPVSTGAARIVELVPAGVVAPLVTPLKPVSGAVVSMLVSIESPARPDPDRWCWPHSSAMTGREIDTMVERTSLFNRRGLPALQAELLADKLVTRDREADDRRLCLECAHLSRTGGAMRCAQWQRAGLGAPGIPAGLVLVLQRCDAFRDQTPRGAP